MGVSDKIHFRSAAQEVICSSASTSVTGNAADCGNPIKKKNSLSSISGVSRISARGVLKVRPHTKSENGGGGGGGGASGPIYEKWGAAGQR